MAEHRRGRRVAQDMSTLVAALDAAALERALDQAFNRDAVDRPQRRIFGGEQGWCGQCRPAASYVGEQRVADLLGERQQFLAPAFAA